LTVDAVDAIHRPLQRLRPPQLGRRGRLPQFQLRVRLDQLVGRDRHRAHRDPPRHRDVERPLRRLPELAVERPGGQRDAALGAGVVGVFDPHREPPRREPPPAEPPAQPLGEPAEQVVQHAEIVAVGGQGVGEAVFRPHFRRQHRPRVNAAGLGAEQPSPAPEDGAELALGNGRDLPDPLELVLVEPLPDVLGDFGQNAHRVRGEERGFVPWRTGGRAVGRTEQPH
jgi:hypothetical protein